MFTPHIWSNTARIAFALVAWLFLSISVSGNAENEPDAVHVMADHAPLGGHDCCPGVIDESASAHSDHKDEHSHDLDCNNCNTCVVHQSRGSIPGLVLTRRLSPQTVRVFSGFAAVSTNDAFDHAHQISDLSVANAGNVSFLILNRVFLL